MDADHAADESARLVSDVSYKLECEDGTPAEPPTIRNSVPSWRPGDTIPLGRDCSLLVIDPTLHRAQSITREPINFGLHWCPSLRGRAG